MDKQKYRCIFDELSDGCCHTNKYCTYKEVLLHIARDARILVQWKCIEKYKYDMETSTKSEIGWSKAAMDWVDDGLAEIFAEEYSEDISINALYKKIIDKKKKFKKDQEK